MQGQSKDGSDAELVRLTLAGNEQAFTGLMSRHKAWLFRFIRRYVGNNEDALDLLQDTLVSTWQALHRYDPERPFAAWLRQIALNKCRDWGRRSLLRGVVSYLSGDIDDVPAEMPASDPEALLATDQALRCLDDAIASLPLRLREPLILTVFEGLSQREAAELLRVSEKSIETRVYRARKQLARAIENVGLREQHEETSP